MKPSISILLKESTLGVHQVLTPSVHTSAAVSDEGRWDLRNDNVQLGNQLWDCCWSWWSKDPRLEPTKDSKVHDVHVTRAGWPILSPTTSLGKQSNWSLTLPWSKLTLKEGNDSAMAMCFYCKPVLLTQEMSKYNLQKKFSANL